jgi:hypothetical protein
MPFTSRTKFFENIWSLYNRGNGLYRVLTTAKRALSFQQRRAFIQEIHFSLFKWGISDQKKAGTFFTFKKVGGGGGAHAPIAPPGSATPGSKSLLIKHLCAPKHCEACKETFLLICLPN